MANTVDNQIQPSLWQRAKEWFLRLSYRTQVFVVIGGLVIVGAVGTFAALGGLTPTQGVRLFITPVSDTVTINNTLNIDLMLDTGGMDVVAVSAVLQFDNNYFNINCAGTNDCLAVDVNSTYFSQIAQREVSGDRLYVVVGNVEPVNGKDIPVARIQLKSIAPVVDTPVSLVSVDSAVIVNDGFGTNILHTVEGAMYTVTDGATATTTSDIIISNIQAAVDASNPQSCAATITWDTNIDAYSTVYYCRGVSDMSCNTDVFTSTPQEGGTAIGGGALVAEHSVNLLNLTCNQTYYYRVRSADADNNATLSQTLNFFTGEEGAADIPLAITNVGVNPYARSAVVTWSTNKRADSSLTINAGGATFTNSSIATLFHSIKISDLEPATAYSVTVISTTDSGESASDTIDFSTTPEDLTKDSNIIVKASRDRVCAAWLECTSSVTIENVQGNQEDLCFDFALCDELDPSTGKCTNIRRFTDPSFKVVIGDASQSTIDSARFLTGAIKAGAQWLGTCSDGAPCLTDNDCSSGSCASVGSDSQTVIRGDVDGFSSFDNMEQVGSSLSVPNGDFESGLELPWRPRFTSSEHTDIVNVITDRSNSSADLNKVLSVQPVSNSNSVSGVKVGVGRTNRADTQYYVSFDVRSDDPKIKKLIVQFGFNDYEYFVNYATDIVPVSSGWQRVIAGPLEVQSSDANRAALGRQTMLGFLFDKEGTNAPYQPFYIDNVAVHPVLKASADINIVRSCRAYPAEDASACTYVDLNSGRELQGWEGYCVEVDPRNPRRCIQWYPVDVIAGGQSILSSDAPAGYTGRKPLYYCTEASGNYPYERKVSVSDLFVGGYQLLRGSQGGGWQRHSGLIDFDFIVDTQSNEFLPAIIHDYDVDHVTFRIVNGDYDDNDNPLWPIGEEFHVNVAAGQREFVWCGGDPTPSGKCPTQATLLNEDSTDYWEYFVSDDAKCIDFGGAADDDDNIFGIRVNFDDQTGLLRNIEAGLCNGPDDSDNKGQMTIETIFYLREVCTEIVQAVSPFGDNAVWSNRFVESSGYSVAALGYGYDQDYAPYGAIVPPKPDYDPEKWDSSSSAAGIQPLYIEPPNTRLFPQEPHQTRAGAPYGISVRYLSPDKRIGEAQCIAGELLGLSCYSNDDCRVDPVSGSLGVCTGINAPVGTNENLFNGAMSDPVANLSELVARTEAVWRWDPYVDRYRQVCFAPGECSDYVCTYFDTAYHQKRGAVCDPNYTDASGAWPDCPDGGSCLAFGPSKVYGWDKTADIGAGVGSGICVVGQTGKSCAGNDECDILGDGICKEVSNWICSGGVAAGQPCNPYLLSCGLSGVCTQQVSDSVCEGGAQAGTICQTDHDCAPVETKGVCSTSVAIEGQTSPPWIDHINITGTYQKVQGNTNTPVAVLDGDSITLSFNSHVSPAQKPLVRYTVDWGDGRVSEESALKIEPKIDQNRPHLLAHTYFCEENGLGWSASTSSCNFKPRIQIEDNWGWCSGGLDSSGNAITVNPANGVIDNHSGTIACNSWDIFAGTIQVFSGTGNKLPVASFTMSPSSGPAPLAVTFNAAGSVDPDGSIVSRSWDIDGTPAGGNSSIWSYNFPNQGTYTVTLTVTDDAGASATVPKQVVVGAPAPVTVTVDTSAVGSVGVGDTVTVPVRISNVPASASISDITSFEISFDSSVLGIDSSATSQAVPSLIIPTSGTLMEGWNIVEMHGTTAGSINISYADTGSSGSPITSDGVLFNILFTAQQMGRSDITLGSVVLGSTYKTGTNITPTHGQITVAPPSLTVSAGTGSVSVGDIVDIPISVSGVSAGTPIDSISMRVSYDNTLVDLYSTGAHNSPADLTYGWAHNTDFATDVVTANGGSSSVTSDGILFHVSFEGLAEGQTTITLDQVSLQDSSGNTYTTPVNGGSITVGPDSSPSISGLEVLVGGTPATWALNGQRVDFRITPTDPDGAPMTLDIDWKGATAANQSYPNLPSGQQFPFSALFDTDGTYTFTFTITDAEGKTATASYTFTVIKWFGGSNSAYQYRRAFNVVNSAGGAVDAGYPVQIALDTASLVSAGKMQSDADDLRIVYQNGATLIELDRIVVYPNAASTYVWFALENGIPAGGTDGNYWVYYGAPSVAGPPADVNVVFQPKSDSNTVALYHFEDGTGTSLTDSSTYGNNGTLTNGPTWQAGRFGQALDFDGSNDFVKIAHQAQLALPAGTIEMWATANTGRTTSETYFSKEIDEAVSASEDIFVMIDQGNVALPGLLLFRLQDLASNNLHIHSNKDEGFDVWHHVAFTWGPAGAQMYLNGVKQGETAPTWTKGIQNNTQPLYLGTNAFRDPGNGSGLRYYLDGRLDGVRVSNIQRTSFPYATRAKGDDPTSAFTKREESQGNPIVAHGVPQVAGASTYAGDGTEIKKDTGIHVSDIWDSMKFTGRLIKKLID